jgi:hypothetical protein
MGLLPEDVAESRDGADLLHCHERGKVLDGGRPYQHDQPSLTLR